MSWKQFAGGGDVRSGNHQVSVAFIQMVLVVQTQVYQSSARIIRQQGASAPQKTRCLLNESGAAQRPPGNPWRLNPQREVLWGAGGDRRGRGEEDLTNSGPFELSGAHSPRGALGLEGKNTSSRKLFPWTPERKARAPTRFPGRQRALGFRGRSGRRGGAGRSRISAPRLGSPSSASPSASLPAHGSG